MNAPQRHINLFEEQGIKQRVQINLLKQTTGGPVATRRETHEDKACRGVRLATLPLQHHRSNGIPVYGIAVMPRVFHDYC